MAAIPKSLGADEARLREALDGADIAPLIMVLVQLTGDAALLDEVRPWIKGPWDYSNTIPAARQAGIRDRLAAVLEDYAASGRPLPDAPSGPLLQQMMSVCVGEAVPDEYVPMMLEEMALTARDPKGVAWRREPAREELEKFQVLVIGAGMSGLCIAVKLQAAGIPFTVIEKNDAVGGTWYENSYPGCGVDTPNHFYSYSFETDHHWPDFYSKRNELWRYFERVADKYGLREKIRFATEVTSAAYDEARGIWRVALKDRNGNERTVEANAVVSAVGQLNRPKYPEIEGMDGFAGPVFHTGHWRHDVDLAGKRVAVIGTGASAQQTVPAIAGTVGHLTVFQRSPHWVVPNPNYHRSVSEQKKWAIEYLPFYAKWYRFTLFWGFADGIHASLQKDPAWPHKERSLNAVNDRHRQSIERWIRKELEGREDLVAKVIPPYPPYGKRILIDNHWYRTLRRDNVSLVTGDIARIEADAVVTSDGQRHPVDVIVLATGFQAARMLTPMEVAGRGGATLRDLWGEDDPKAYLGIAVPGFPNFFMLYGPNTNLGHGGSAIFHSECQVRYVMQCLRELLEGGHRSIEVRAEVHDDYNRRVDAAHEGMVWTHGGMCNWYRNSQGRVITNSPWRLVDYWNWTSEVKPEEFLVA